MKVEIAPKAQREATEAAEWYERQEAGLGDGFLAAFDAALERIGENPLGGSILETQDNPEIRRILTERFPYLVVYDCAQLPRRVRIIAVSHNRRRPNYWQGR